MITTRRTALGGFLFEGLGSLHRSIQKNISLRRMKNVKEDRRKD